MKKRRFEHGNISLGVSGCCILFILVFFANGYSQDIHRAVSEGDHEKVESLLKENPLLVNKEDANGRTPIFTAIMRRNREMVKFLIEHGADINIQCNSLTTPLYFASLNNNLEYLNYLLDAGADVDTPDFLNRTPLYVAVRDRCKEIVKTLMDNGADFHIRDTHLNRSLVHLASIQGHREIAEVLIHEGMDINGKDERGYTSLDYAYRYGHDSMAEFLEKNGGKSSLISNPSSGFQVFPTITSLRKKILKRSNSSWRISPISIFYSWGHRRESARRRETGSENPLSNRCAWIPR